MNGGRRFVVLSQPFSAFFQTLTIVLDVPANGDMLYLITFIFKRFTHVVIVTCFQ